MVGGADLARGWLRRWRGGDVQVESSGNFWQFGKADKFKLLDDQLNEMALCLLASELLTNDKCYSVACLGFLTSKVPVKYSLDCLLIVEESLVKEKSQEALKTQLERQPT